MEKMKCFVPEKIPRNGEPRKQNKFSSEWAYKEKYLEGDFKLLKRLNALRFLRGWGF